MTYKLQQLVCVIQKVIMIAHVDQVKETHKHTTILYNFNYLNKVADFEELVAYTSIIYKMNVFLTIQR